jgi:hypothetical protein
MEALIFLGIVAFGLLIWVDYIIASKFSELSRDKGYEKTTAFHMCFWLGIVGYIYVAAMPTLTSKHVSENVNSTAADEDKGVQPDKCDELDINDPEKESVYLEAKAKMQRGSGYNCARFYKEAIALLETIRDYKDALKLIDECNEKAGKLTEN